VGNISYHLEELEIARNSDDDRMVMPTLLKSEKVIMDIGCGIGQTFIALNCTDRTCIGIDIDQEALEYGTEKFGDDIQFILADAKRLPIPADSLNLVFSRVSLPYTNIPQVIKEIKRALKKDGRVWMTLHGQHFAFKYLKEALKTPFNIKQLLHVIYILANGYLLKYFGIVLPFLNGKYESWQDTSAMRKLLSKNGFQVNKYKDGSHTIIEGLLK